VSASGRDAEARTGSGRAGRSTRPPAGWASRGQGRLPGVRAGALARPTPALAGKAGALAASWAPVAGRVLLGLVFAWFGYHELVQPRLWTGYVPLLAPASPVAAVAVLIHGWVLLMLAVALAAGIATRLAALLATVVMLEIVISLTVTAGLSDLTLRDVGVLGLAVCLTGTRQQRLVLRR
jgi:uncharacterized membrane protein YphA (DoxX/SURF4 family)